MIWGNFTSKSFLFWQAVFQFIVINSTGKTLQTPVTPQGQVSANGLPSTEAAFCGFLLYLKPWSISWADNHPVIIYKQRVTHYDPLTVTWTDQENRPPYPTWSEQKSLTSVASLHKTWESGELAQQWRALAARAESLLRARVRLPAPTLQLTITWNSTSTGSDALFSSAQALSAQVHLTYKTTMHIKQINFKNKNET